MSSFSISAGDFLDRLLTIKNAAMAPITKTDITIPAIAPAPIPDLLSPLPLPPPLDEPPLPPDLCFGLGFVAGGVPGGGGGAGPELNELPFVLLKQAKQVYFSQSFFEETMHIVSNIWIVRCLLKVYAFQLVGDPSSKTVIFNIP